MTEAERARIAEQFYRDLLGREKHARGDTSEIHEAEIGRVVASGPGFTITCYTELTRCTVEVNPNSDETWSWYVDFAAKEGDRTMSEEDAMARAVAVAKPPEDAFVEFAGYQRVADRVLYRVRFGHRHQGFSVENDFRDVMINGKTGRVFSYAAKWRTPDPDKPGKLR